MLFPHSTQAGSLLVKISVGRFCHLPDGTTFAVHDSPPHPGQQHKGQQEQQEQKEQSEQKTDKPTKTISSSSNTSTQREKVDRNCDRYMFWGLRGEVQASTVYKVVDMAGR